MFCRKDFFFKKTCFERIGWLFHLKTIPGSDAKAIRNLFFPAVELYH